ncbi:hypothetical protein ACHQM5_017978 [Ranunculus cassubicifolius]
MLKISDFGLSALPQQVQEDGLLHTSCGTTNYVAPEICKADFTCPAWFSANARKLVKRILDPNPTSVCSVSYLLLCYEQEFNLLEHIYFVHSFSSSIYKRSYCSQ